MPDAPPPLCARCATQPAPQVYTGSPVYPSYAGAPLCGACAALIDHLTATVPIARQAWRHIQTKTCAGATEAQRLAVRQSPQVRQAMARVDEVAATGDMLAMRSACQRWNRAVRDALEEAKTDERDTGKTGAPTTVTTTAQSAT